MVGLLKAELRTRIKMKMWVPSETKGTRVSTAPMIKILETKEEEAKEEDKGREEEAFVVHAFTVEKKAIEPMSALNAKEGQIREVKVKQGLLMWMMMPSHHIERMWKEERSWLIKRSY